MGDEMQKCRNGKMFRWEWYSRWIRAVVVTMKRREKKEKKKKEREMERGASGHRDGRAVCRG